MLPFRWIKMYIIHSGANLLVRSLALTEVWSLISWFRSKPILRCFECREPSLFFQAFTVYVRPILEYCSPVCNPVYIGDIKRTEAVQRRFTKIIAWLYRHVSYAERLRLLGAESLEWQRLKLNLVLMYKILHGLVANDSLFNLGLIVEHVVNLKFLI